MHKQSRRSIHRRIWDRKGMTTVEFALVGPAFFLVIFASIEFARLNMIRNLTQDAAYFAARHTMVPGATSEEAVEEANKILGYMNTEGAEVIITATDTDTGVTTSSINDESDIVSVTINVPVSENSFLVPNFTDDLEFTATATLKTERYDGYYDPFDH